MKLVPECPLCYLARKERENYRRFHRVELGIHEAALPCATCGVTTFWLIGDRLPERIGKHGVAA